MGVDHNHTMRVVGFEVDRNSNSPHLLSVDLQKFLQICEQTGRKNRLLCDFHVQGSIARVIAPKIEFIGEIFIVTMKVLLNALHEGHPLFAINLRIVGTSLPQSAPTFEVGLADRISFGQVRACGFAARIGCETPEASGGRTCRNHVSDNQLLKVAMLHEPSIVNFLGLE